MKQKDQTTQLSDLFNKEQGVFAYYLCGILLVMIGYSYRVVLLSNSQFTIIPIIAILVMFLSLAFGLNFLRYRVSNYYNSIQILELLKQVNNDSDRQSCINTIEENSKKQSFYLKSMWVTLAVGPFLMFIWLALIKFI